LLVQFLVLERQLFTLVLQFFVLSGQLFGLSLKLLVLPGDQPIPCSQFAIAPLELRLLRVYPINEA
jgi:hypothetical protein